MADFQPPPTFADPVIVDEQTKRGKFNPIWLKWFLDLTQVISASGGSGGAIAHNATSGLQGGTANQYFHLTSAQHGAILTSASGTYTPTLNNTTNVDASTAYECQYLRIGATVTVSGRVDVDPTAAAATVLGISLPIASNFGAVEDCAGAGASPEVAGLSVAVRANVANDRAELAWVAVDTADRAFYFTFTYQII